MAKKSQIKYPLHLAVDAQGPMGIMDATGKAVVWFSETHYPLHGYVWEPEDKPSPDPNGMGGTTYWKQRNAVVRAIFELLNAQPTTRKAQRKKDLEQMEAIGRDLHGPDK